MNENPLFFVYNCIHIECKNIKWTKIIQSSNLQVRRSNRLGGVLCLSMDKTPVPLIRLLLARLERIYADSIWAHRASGVRGRLLRELEKIGTNHYILTDKTYKPIDVNFHILEKAVCEKIRPNKK